MATEMSRPTASLVLPPWLNTALPHLVTLALYLLLTTWASQFMLDDPPVPLLWPATGIGLAMVYRHGYSIALTLVIAGAIAHMSFGAGVGSALVLSAGAAAGAVAGTVLLRRLEFSGALERVRDVVKLLLVGALVSAFVSAFSGTLVMVGITSAFTETLGLCWLADTMGVLLFAPFLISVRLDQERLLPAVQSLLLIALVPAVSWLAYAGDLPDHIALPLSYATFPLILFLAFRLPPAGVALATLLSAMVAIGCTVLGKGPFAQSVDMRPDLVSLFVQLAILQLTALILVAIRYERSEAERRARENLRTLARAGRLNAVSTMAAGIAHELNQPLCSVNSYAQAAVRLIDRQADPAELKEPLARIVDGTQRASDIVKRTRSFLQSGEIKRTACDLDTLVGDAITLLKPEFQRYEMKVSVAPSRERLLIHADGLEIQQVLVNLLHNALEAVRQSQDPGKGRVRIAIRHVKERERAEVVVEDNGPGLPVDDCEQLFDPLTSHRQGGMGLGLAIARSIVEAHGGMLTATLAATGSGAVFRVELPCALNGRGDNG